MGNRQGSEAEEISGERKIWADRLQGKSGNIWVEIDDLIEEYKAVNIGKGFPDFLPPHHITKCLTKTASSDDPSLQQYTRNNGHPRLVNSIAKLYSPVLEREIDPMSEILVTPGADGSLFYAALGFINPGEEAIIIEPAFDMYEPVVKFAGGVPVYVPLRPVKTGKDRSSADWKFDEKELAAKFNSKTKVIILNTPSNPLGKVYTQEELELIADLCIKHDVICISDEVYEWMIYPGQKHIKIATLPGMWERTITIGSVGKAFSVTGWKLGWSVGPADLIGAMSIVHRSSIFVCPTPLQEAVGCAFEYEQTVVGKPESYFVEIVKELIEKRKKMAEMLTHAGMLPSIPDGSYFMIADASHLGFEIDEESPDDKNVQVVKWLIKNKRIAGIPVSTFYSEEYKHLAESYVRFCFFKDDTTLNKAEEIIKSF